jgi:hypothetical protein
MPRWPQTDDEWTEALQAAVFCLAVHSAIAYGLVTGPEIDVERCDALIAEGHFLGHYVPTLEEVMA